ncbi:MAG: hypothetical protein AAF638_08435 [Pseudomonadota bacterium]
MILIAGQPDEPPVALVMEALDEMGAGYHVLDQDQFANTTFDTGVSDGGALTTALTLDGETIDLSRLTGVYVRLMDFPGGADDDRNNPQLQHARGIQKRLNIWFDLVPARVLNRPAAMASNASKPFQALAIRQCGFHIPETLITNDPVEARTFAEAAWDEGGGIIYKSISGVRSIVVEMKPDDLNRLDSIRWCPVQFQKKVPGRDVRVHVVGGEVFAAGIDSDAVDYRYAARQTDRDAELSAITLDTEIANAALRLSEMLSLPLTGIDLRISAEGHVTCFEANPSPAYSYYQNRTGLPIANAIARYLLGQSAPTV